MITVGTYRVRPFAGHQQTFRLSRWAGRARHVPTQLPFSPPRAGFFVNCGMNKGHRILRSPRYRDASRGRSSEMP